MITTMAQRAAKLLGAGGVLLVFASFPAFAHHLEKHFPVKAHAVVSIHNPNGMITVHSWQKPEVQVIADHDSPEVEVDAVQRDNSVDLLTHVMSDNVTPADLRADYTLMVPEDTELQIHDDSGAVEVANVDGDMSVETATAGVNLEDIGGYLSVKTVGGSVDCLRCMGRIEIASFSGNFRLLQDHSKNIRAHTLRGNILFDSDFLPNGVYSLRNYSGVIEVRFSPTDSFTLNATSQRGRVNNEAALIPPSHPARTAPRFGRAMFGSINDGRARVELTSLNGTINIRKRD